MSFDLTSRPGSCPPGGPDRPFSSGEREFEVVGKPPGEISLFAPGIDRVSFTWVSGPVDRLWRVGCDCVCCDEKAFEFENVANGLRWSGSLSLVPFLPNGGKSSMFVVGG